MNATRRDREQQLVRRADFIASLREATDELYGDDAWSAIYANAMRRLELKTVQREASASGWET